MRSLVSFIFILILVSELPCEALLVSRTSWLSQFETYFDTGFCDKADFQKTCFKSSSSECRSKVKTLIPLCAKEKALPESIEEGDKGAAIGAQLGRCISLKLFEVNKPGKVSPKCSDLSNW